MNNDCALLIGVSDYRAYDESAQQPPGTSDLPGSLNDVRAWLRLCREIGIQKIRILSSPAMELDEEGVEQREATSEEVRAGVAWLAEQLGGPGIPEDRPIGLLVFSGHGDQTSQGDLVLCTADTRACEGELENVVNLTTVQGFLAAANAERNLTVVLDCCHDGSVAVHGKHRVTSLRARSGAMPSRARPRLGERTMYAASPGEPAYQADFGVNGGELHGAFTWAFMTARNRWMTRAQGGASELTISYSRMRDVTRDLLRSLDFEQTPQLDCAADVALLPIFHRGLSATPGETSAAPNQDGSLKQCDPGIWDYRLYTFMQGQTKIADMLVARTADPQGRYSQSYEYWMMQNVPQGTATTTVSMVDYPWSTSPPNPNRVSFTMVQSATWVNRAPNNGTIPLLTNTSDTIGIQWNLTLTSGVWGGSIIWSRNNYSGNPNTLFAGPAQTQVFSLTSRVPASLTYNAVVPTR